MARIYIPNETPLARAARGFGAPGVEYKLADFTGPECAGWIPQNSLRPIGPGLIAGSLPIVPISPDKDGLSYHITTQGRQDFPDGSNDWHQQCPDSVTLFVVFKVVDDNSVSAIVNIGSNTSYKLLVERRGSAKDIYVGWELLDSNGDYQTVGADASINGDLMSVGIRFDGSNVNIRIKNITQGTVQTSDSTATGTAGLGFDSSAFGPTPTTSVETRTYGLVVDRNNAWPEALFNQIVDEGALWRVFESANQAPFFIGTEAAAATSQYFIPAQSPLTRALRGFDAPNVKPLGATVVNFSHPLARGINDVFLFDAQQRKSLVKNQSITYDANVTLEGDRAVLGAGDQDFSVGELDISNDFTFLVVADAGLHASGRDYESHIELHKKPPYDWNSYIKYNDFAADDNYNVNVTTSSGSTDSSTYNATFSQYAPYYTYGIRVKNGEVSGSYNDHIQSFLSFTGSLTSQTYECRFVEVNGKEAYNGKFMLLLWDRALSDSEILSLYRDGPYQFLQPANQSPYPIGTAGVVATQINATTDALTITEYNCTVEAGVATEIDATLDTLTLTEYKTTVSADTSVSATADSLTITEYAATISAGTNLSATSEALTLTEYNTTVSFNVNVSTTADTLTIIDYPVSLGTNVNAAVDALTITSYNASISLDVGVSATSEALTITDYNATVATGANVAATLDTLTITDYNVSVGYDISLTATADSLTITEYNATVQANVDTDITATLEALTLTEFNTNVAFGTGITATTDALTLTEYNATIGTVINTNISAGVEALTLTEYNSSVSAPGTTTLTAQDIANIEAAFKDAVRSVLFVDNNT